MKDYYEVPTQVLFFDEMDLPNYGIAYRGEVICGCCGGVFTIDEICQYSPREEPIKDSKEWVNFAQYIL